MWQHAGLRFKNRTKRWGETVKLHHTKPKKTLQISFPISTPPPRPPVPFLQSRPVSPTPTKPGLVVLLSSPDLQLAPGESPEFSRSALRLVATPRAARGLWTGALQFAGEEALALPPRAPGLRTRSRGGTRTNRAARRGNLGFR
jgi:hypothetical protein